MNEQELSQAVNGLRDQITSLVERIAKLENQVDALIQKDREVSGMRRQMLLAVFGVGLAQLVAVLWAVFKLVPK